MRHGQRLRQDTSFHLPKATLYSSVDIWTFREFLILQSTVTVTIMHKIPKHYHAALSHNLEGNHAAKCQCRTHAVALGK